MSMALDDDFFDIFKPFHYTYGLFGHNKFKIKKNNISVIKTKNLFKMMLTDVFEILLLYVTMSYTVFSNNSFFTIYIFTYSHYVINFLILSILTFVQRKNNVELIMKLQNIDRRLYDERHTMICKFFTWISIGTIFVLYFCLVSIKLCLDDHWNIFRAFFILNTLLFNLELAYCVVILVYLGLKLDKLMEMTKKMDFNDNGEENKHNTKMVLEIFYEIFDAINMTNDTNKIIILIHIISMFIQTITYIGILIMWTKYGMKFGHSLLAEVTHFIGVLLWVFKDLLVETALCLSSEYIYSKVADANFEFHPDPAKFGSAPHRHIIKNLQRHLKVNFHKLNGCGVFTVDAALPLRVSSLMATYTIVLLQFAFL